MHIIKRNGEPQPYMREKIIVAISAAFRSVQNPLAPEVPAIITDLAAEVERQLFEMNRAGVPVHVEKIQDFVEKTLTKYNHSDEVKSFILYRDDRTKKRIAREQIACCFTDSSVLGVLKEIQQDFPFPEYSLDALASKFLLFKKEVTDERRSMQLLIKAAVELTAQEAPQWELIAARLLMLDFSLALGTSLEKLNIHSFYEKITYLEEAGLYGVYIRTHYSRAEIEEAATYLECSRDKLFTYSSLDMILRRYVIRTRAHVPLETPQEMFLGIALHLAMNETQDRMQWVKRFYTVLSKLQVTVATPTLSNARKPFHQLSSCFVDTVPDSLDGIYRSIDNFSQVSKFGGGMGLYFGKVRAVGAPIRGFQGAAGGILRWIKLANDTAVAVDQLGVRQGSVAVYLDVWHKDIPEFLQLRTNNGDDRMKAHDVFPAVCYPDLFWKTVRDNLGASWYLMCPHEILTVKGYALEDFYAEEWEKRYWDCVKDARISKRTIPIKELVRLVLKSVVETGTPFAFYRDHANRANPNGHRGIIYCSNLCTEIAQNMSAINLVSVKITEVDGQKVVVQTTRPGDFVVCNLASLVLSNIDLSDDKELREVVRVAVRALDNVIDLTYYPVPYAQVTNAYYRAIGLGVSGYHHVLAQQGIDWESDEHLAFADRIFERINRAAIEASMTIAREKGAYGCFTGSDWCTGAYFRKRGYVSEDWQRLQREVATHGMRNGYLLAVAPTSSTSIIAGTTAGVDPIMKQYFLEEKKGMLMPRVAPSLSQKTCPLYKSAHAVEQRWSIRAAGLRQRHIDQAQSVNLYITTDFTLKQVLDLYVYAWEVGMKSLYYVRSQSLEIDLCGYCAS
ncbi:ribonucleoside-diphosphate reductase subunit alpha [Treponema pallidum]|uniref:Ribonucleoside-diphosphate reductase subunit alpha n=3 Tax=Treponema pallidum TaxID=160 RepID=RIR1_TREPA|nr:ribonucleoside-diphosphate reductase subunit alpha [Treponema pallidum]O83972.1 RecName: Full=Ribonucleoside-diphosphate reductase subunit alpha; AltName: Full=Ribonucleotide reductase [Treponema pallidum subsp. pallidum str. Nichols]AAC65956.1 ribonucleoside-diphosphate reductase, subunit alpha (nrdA) [Treponema pallidum subsp. pallidum str. Nichols]ACD71424.1 ribonucleoside-diphosphate reductase, subunit alpha [Treponema pallidum subsp. pallidum SS14]ADD73100.1 ribonucleoside-diphosphate r